MTRQFLPMATAPRLSKEVIQLHIDTEKVVAAFYDPDDKEWTFLDPKDPSGLFTNWPDDPLYVFGWLPLAEPAT